ncbi:MAG: hypothetical protein COT71_00670 [Candidatus Andersenbacteria bacterium CG10_big_fil_rev_8_21_14_0_10_54_11]|uniref:Sortase n=1 Tax=Candidatus Andersenbacteria bacterium CG10_big_fil_rev_8_21_14_0_10_54_11 TaxID=1974485 RepID=A0A2M6X099_9BACT|nr:MAG: hypothetical protein COT71_00670 [Candidatus Andersenbacteria bacterium CG10_big_fil_rev_8_21_14_0_10_54_11]
MKLARPLGTAASAVLVFGSGIAAGAYYHTELSVLWQHMVRARFEAPFAPIPIPSPAASASAIELPGLGESLPLVYSDTLEEDKIQDLLKKGAVVLPLGTAFGEPGNVVVTAHSSGTEAFGPYRFAFAKLAEIKEGQEYTISTPTARYTYRVYGHEIIWPHEVDKLPNDDRSTVTLVTCWPLWTNFKRLLVHSELVNVEYKI